MAQPAINICSGGTPIRFPGWVLYQDFGTPLLRGPAFQEGNATGQAESRDQWSLKLVIAVGSTTTGRVV